jgi:uncharacterized protein
MMPTAITVKIGNLELKGELNDSATGKALAGMLPTIVKMSRWGEEYYGALPKALNMDEGPDARDEMEVGELAYWPPGNALCIFFGPTPASSGDEPRAASPVNPVGMLRGDVAGLKGLGRSVTASVTKA